MTSSRNLGLDALDTEIVAFVDDDAFVHPGWAEAIVRPYEDGSVGAVGGRVVSADAEVYLDQPQRTDIGHLTDDGQLIGNFESPAAGELDVTHVMGCNMSFRRSILEQLGGLREAYTGISGIEDTDACLRVKGLGYRVIFAPQAVVTHVGAPQSKGERFDLTYSYYSERNHAILLLQNLGLKSSIVHRYLLRRGREFVVHAWDRLRRGRILAAGGRFAARVRGLVVGLCMGLYAIHRPRPVGPTARRSQLDRLADRTRWVHVNRPRALRHTTGLNDIRIR